MYRVQDYFPGMDSGDFLCFVRVDVDHDVFYLGE
jgi:hypothetical protein